jgi:hypothetical protein
MRKARVALTEAALLTKNKIFKQLAQNVFILTAKTNYSPYF